MFGKKIWISLYSEYSLNSKISNLLKTINMKKILYFITIIEYILKLLKIRRVKPKHLELTITLGTTGICNTPSLVETTKPIFLFSIRDKN